MKKTLGILGGMGPAATADLYGKVVSLTAATKDGDHIRTIIDSNVNIPDRTQAILSGGENPIPEMTKALENLIKCGAQIIIVPCNTAHYFLPELKEAAKGLTRAANSTDEAANDLTGAANCTDDAANDLTEAAKGRVEFISMIEETAKACSQLMPKTAAVLATKGTLESGLYQKALDELGVNYIVPDEAGKDVLMDVIYKGVKAGADPSTYLPGFRALLDRLAEKGADYFVLACTELPIAFRELLESKSGVARQNADGQPQPSTAGTARQNADGQPQPGTACDGTYESVDPTEVLATAAVRACGYEVK